MVSSNNTESERAKINTKAWAEWLRFETKDDRELERMVDCAATWMRRKRDGLSPCWLSLIGETGTGKTHIAKRIWESHRNLLDFSKTKFTPELIYWPICAEQLREASRNGQGSERLLDMAKWPLLVLDDVLAERDQTGFVLDKLATLLGARVGKWTVITSNKSLEQIAKADVRIASRITREDGNQVCDVRTMDYRLRR